MIRTLIRTAAVVAASAAAALSSTAAMAAAATGSYGATYTCTLGCSATYSHTYSISLNCDGTFAGTGYWNGDPNYKEAVAGRAIGTRVHYTSVYTTIYSGYTVTVDGVYNLHSHSLTGTAVDNYNQRFSVSAVQISFTFDPSTCFSGGYGR